MDIIRQTYRILFSIEFNLVGFQDDVNPFIRITPDESTLKFFSDANVLTKKAKNTIIFLIAVENSIAQFGQPKVIPDDGQIFRFYVKFTDLLFFERTHLTDYDFDADVLLISNQVNHVVGTNILLTKTIDNYNSSNEYRMGYLARGGGNYYRAIQSSNSGDVHGVGETAYWRAIPDGMYLSQADLQARLPGTETDCQMIIEIKYSASLSADYRLLDASFKCREVNYKVRLLK
jgi:hypothetical protein